MYGISELKKIVGQTVTEISGMKQGEEECALKTKEGNELILRYEHDCCASCDIAQIDGDPLDLLGSPLVMAELVSNDEPAKNEGGYTSESFTWTFVKFATVKGYVTLRWYGESNGYYSEAPTAYYNGETHWSSDE